MSDDKSTKEQAKYRNGHPGRCCQLCDMWRPPNSCSSVDGMIKPTGLCDYFKRK